MNDQYDVDGHGKNDGLPFYNLIKDIALRLPDVPQTPAYELKFSREEFEGYYTQYHQNIKLEKY